MKKIGIEHALIGAILLSIVVRLYFVLTVPLFDNDSIVNLFLGKALATHGIIPKSNTLAALLIGTGFFVFGENILVGRLVELFAAIATTYLSYKMGIKFFDKRAGLFAAFLVSYIPLHIFYSTISKIYCVLALFVMLSLYTFLVGFIERKPLVSLSSAVFLFLAFLCKTYAAIGIFPMMVIFLIDIIKRKYRKREITVTLKHVGSPIFLFAFLVALNILWKLPEFGMSFYQDVPADLLRAISSQYFRRPWHSLMAFNSIAPFTLLPLIVLSIINSGKRSGLVDRVIYIFIVANIMVVILNPLNHAPRGFIPSIPLLCVIAGAALSRLMNTADASRSNLARLFALSSTTVLFVIVYLTGGKIGYLSFFKMNSPQTIFASFAAIIGCFLVFQSISIQIAKRIKIDLFQKKKIRYLIITLFFLSYGIFGIDLSRKRLEQRAKAFYPVLEAVSFAPSCNILGGEDLVNLFKGSSFPLISDLPLEDVRKFVSGDVIPVLKKHEINNIIIGGNGCTIDEFFLKDIGEKHGIPWPKHRQAIYASKDIDRTFDNGTASLYTYGPLPRSNCNKTDILKNYRVPLQHSMGGSKLYWLKSPPFNTILSFCIENGNPTQREYLVKVAEIPRVDIETVDFDRNPKLFFSKKVTIKGFSKKKIDIHLGKFRKHRIGVCVRNIREGINYYIYS